MEHENFAIEIDGQEEEDLYLDLIRLEVELDEELAGMFRMYFAILQQPDGVWAYLDDDRLTLWKPVKIAAGFEDGMEELISGYITHVKPNFDPDPSKCILEVWGLDNSVLMDRHEKLKDWPNKKDSDIASEIFNEYGLTPNVEDSGVVHDETVSTIIQRETDMQFLRRLALRNGYECYVEGNKGFFRKPELDGFPQPVLAVHFGEETNVNLLSLEANALQPAEVSMLQIDRTNKEVLDESADSSQQPSLGATGYEDLLGMGIDAGQVYISMNTATGNAEMIALCQGLFHRAEWFLTGEGEVNGNAYGHALQPRKTVVIKGVGETYSGVYYVTHVTHVFEPEGYTQHFKVKRNALMPTGTEDFSGSSGPFGSMF
jgi:phage protein D